jgi:hypothetical protein
MSILRRPFGVVRRERDRCVVRGSRALDASGGHLVVGIGSLGHLSLAPLPRVIVPERQHIAGQDQVRKSRQRLREPSERGKYREPQH